MYIGVPTVTLRELWIAKITAQVSVAQAGGYRTCRGVLAAILRNYAKLCALIIGVTCEGSINTKLPLAVSEKAGDRSNDLALSRWQPTAVVMCSDLAWYRLMP